MVWRPMSFIPPQIENASGTPYSGAVLKAYAEGTTTPILMATNSTGATTATSFPINANGNVTSGGAVIIPHVEQNYKLALYPTQAAADANSGAIWTYDSIKITGFDTPATTTITATVPALNISAVNTDGTSNVDLAGSSVSITSVVAPAGITNRRIRVRVTGSNLTFNNGGGITVPNGVSVNFNNGDIFTLVPTGVNTVQIEGIVTANPTSGLFPIAATVASNILTGTINPCQIDFRSPTATSGAFVRRSVTTPLTLNAPVGASFGSVNGQQTLYALLAIDNAGTVELAFINPVGANLDEAFVINTTAISAGSTSAGVAYSTTARTGVPYRVVGLFFATEATAGTWATAPSFVIPGGGLSIPAFLAGLGAGQSWQGVTRNFGTTYYNTTGKPIAMVWLGTGSVLGNFITLTAGGAVGGAAAVTVAASYAALFGIIPVNASYSLSISGGVASVNTCNELR